jgi:hypothetical protein
LAAGRATFRKNTHTNQFKIHFILFALALRHHAPLAAPPAAIILIAAI